MCRGVKVDSGVRKDAAKNLLTKTSISLHRVKSASPVILTPACGNECGNLEGNNSSSRRKRSALTEPVASHRLTPPAPHPALSLLVRGRKSLEALGRASPAGWKAAGIRGGREGPPSPGVRGVPGPSPSPPSARSTAGSEPLPAPRAPEPLPKPSAPVCSCNCI